MKIAFHAIGGAHWPVGQVYLRDLIQATRQTFGAEVQFFLQSPRSSEHDARDFARAVAADDVIYYDVPKRGTLYWLINGFIHRTIGTDLLVGRSLAQHHIDVLLAPGIVSRYARAATLLWLPDFQHIRLPEMFSAEERSFRDKSFRRSARLATRVLLLSQTVREDFDKFAPQFASKARVLQPRAYIPPSVFDRAPDSVLRKYHLPEKFIYLPNQFWKHKNHARVFNALKLLKDRGICPTLVCTGSSMDYRNAAYFTELWQILSHWDIRDQVIYLGLLPHEQVLFLMRQSVCVLNPSLFEGWGYSVEEARAVGKRIVLSDIPVHREQNPPRATFFDPNDPQDLADKLARIWQTTAPGANHGDESLAQRESADRLRAFAESFVAIAQDALRQVRGD